MGLNAKMLGVTLASLLVCPWATAHAATKVSISADRWLINGQPTNPGTASEGKGEGIPARCPVQAG